MDGRRKGEGGAEMEGWTEGKKASQLHNKILREKAKYNL